MKKRYVVLVGGIGDIEKQQEKVDEATKRLPSDHTILSAETELCSRGSSVLYVTTLLVKRNSP
ncbi:MAG: hypothetical protein NTU85_02710 [Candidatus Kaiserbacteria bacterium]|nr:hypothetical protein [Candidatus Kaiserbacteria bacterium]